MRGVHIFKETAGCPARQLTKLPTLAVSWCLVLESVCITLTCARVEDDSTGVQSRSFVSGRNGPISAVSLLRLSFRGQNKRKFVKPDSRGGRNKTVTEGVIQEGRFEMAFQG